MGAGGKQNRVRGARGVDMTPAPELIMWPVAVGFLFCCALAVYSLYVDPPDYDQ